MFDLIALDCEMVQARDKRLLCGRIVVVSMNDKKEMTIIMDEYVSYPDGNAEVRNYLTKWSKIKPEMMAYPKGRPIHEVRRDVIELIGGRTLVTMNGDADFRSLGFDKREIKFLYSLCNHVELQNFFKRPDGSPYGLGPLVEYFNYRESFDKRVVIDHDCIQDAWYTLKLFVDHYDPTLLFIPSKPIPSVSVYRRQHRLE